MCPRRCALSELTRGKMGNGVRRCRGHTRQATRDLARSAGCRLAYLTKAGEARGRPGEPPTHAAAAAGATLDCASFEAGAAPAALSAGGSTGAAAPSASAEAASAGFAAAASPSAHAAASPPLAAGAPSAAASAAAGRSAAPCDHSFCTRATSCGGGASAEGSRGGSAGRSCWLVIATTSASWLYRASRMVCSCAVSVSASEYGTARASTSLAVMPSEYMSQASKLSAGPEAPPRVMSSGAMYGSVPTTYCLKKPPVGRACRVMAPLTASERSAALKSVRTAAPSSRSR
mmetsp:Transcript_51223/g.165451  ORF Transcript_51223/g.165451 Transcript_51223/m.165451 type:complete len:289 (-) Transcript_51223:465-1331(-)